MGAIVGSTLLPVVAIAILHRIGQRPDMQISLTPEGIGSVGLEVAVAAIIRLIGLAIAYWMAISTTLYVVARLAGWTSMVRTVGIFTLPMVKRASDRLLVGSLALATVSAPGVAWSNNPDPNPPISMPIEYQLDETTPTTAIPQPPPVEVPIVFDATNDSSPPEIVIVADATLEVVVRPGDNLWELAARRVNSVMGRPAADHEVAPYWVELINANNDRLRSGDPDLVYPGEVIVLPPVRG